MTQRLDYESLSPKAMRALGGVYQYLADAGLPAALLDLVYLRVSQINGCAFCIGEHTQDARKRGVSVEKVMMVSAWRETGGLFSGRERAALQWAETVTRIATTAAPDADFQAVRAEFSEKEVVDLTVAIGLMNTYNRIAIGFRRPPRIAVPA